MAPERCVFQEEGAPIRIEDEHKGTPQHDRPGPEATGQTLELFHASVQGEDGAAQAADDRGEGYLPVLLKALPPL